MDDDLAFWSYAEMMDNCRILSGVDCLNGDEERYTHFVFVPYGVFRTSHTALSEYRMQAGYEFGCYPVRIDTSDIRHVLFGFTSVVDQDAMLAHTGIITKRKNPIKFY